MIKSVGKLAIDFVWNLCNRLRENDRDKYYRRINLLGIVGKRKSLRQVLRMCDVGGKLLSDIKIILIN